MAESTRIEPRTVVPVFPLPNVVFFPETALPLHVFEPRYREMIRDCRDGDGLLAMTLLHARPPRTSAETEPAEPPIHLVGTLGRIRNLVELPDGRFVFELVGLTRARYQEIPSPGPYRLVHADPLPEPEFDENEPRIAAAKLELLGLHGALIARTRDDAAVVPDTRIGFASVVNQACAGLPAEPQIRQSLLEEHDLMQRQRRVTALLEEALAQLLAEQPMGEAN